eukprot:scaffold71654_cov47-Prasinocladus_malaysianus.AAC.1
MKDESELIAMAKYCAHVGPVYVRGLMSSDSTQASPRPPKEIHSRRVRGTFTSVDPAAGRPGRQELAGPPRGPRPQ